MLYNCGLEYYAVTVRIGSQKNNKTNFLFFSAHISVLKISFGLIIILPCEFFIRKTGWKQESSCSCFLYLVYLNRNIACVSNERLYNEVNARRLEKIVLIQWTYLKANVLPLKTIFKVYNKRKYLSVTYRKWFFSRKLY